MKQLYLYLSLVIVMMQTSPLEWQAVAVTPHKPTQVLCFCLHRLPRRSLLSGGLGSLSSGLRNLPWTVDWGGCCTALRARKRLVLAGTAAPASA